MVRMAFRSRARRLALLRNSVRVVGKIVRLEDTSTDENQSSAVAPVVRYRERGGGEHELVLSPRLDPDSCPVGMKVPVFYELGNPGNAVDAQRMWDVNIICILCLFPVLFGAGILYTVYQEANR